MINYCLYHKSCMDGFAAAYCVWKKYGDTFKYIPVQYSEPLPSLELPIDRLFMVDFSYTDDIKNIEYLDKNCKEFILIDHHKTAQKGLENWNPKKGIKIFDMSFSGCVLTWKYLFPDEEIPLLLSYIEDRDLWKWQLINSKEVSAGFQLLELYDKNGKEYFETFDRYVMCEDDTIIYNLVDTGSTILEYQNKLIRNLAENVQIHKDDNGYTVGSLNSCLFQSELGNHICLNKEVDYADIYFITEGKVIHSLRSIGDFDVSVIAKNHNGGGHKNSAGFVKKL